MKFSSALLQAAAAVVLAAPFAFAQEAAQPVPTEFHVADPATDSLALSGTGTPIEAKPLLNRWVELSNFSHAERYRNAAESTGWHLFEDGQQRSILAGRVKLDNQARYTVNFRASSGIYFNWAFADYAGDGITTRGKEPGAFALYSPTELIGVLGAVAADPGDFAAFEASHSTGWSFYLRELYISASPIKQVTVEFGSLGIERGVSTEITTFDDDGYISGERVRIRDPKHLFFDQIGFTSAFFGDIYTPNLFDRGSSFKTSNYRQFFLDKGLGKRIATSGEYTWQNGTDTLREAASVAIPEVKVVDKVRVELYQRVNVITFEGISPAAGSGFAVAAEKGYRDLKGDAGYASVDTNYAGTYGAERLGVASAFALNGDAYGVGKRVFVHGSYKVNSVVTAFGYYTHAVGPRVLNLNQQGLNAGLNFDLKAMINSKKRVL
jgi:hypothetical protein